MSSVASVGSVLLTKGGDEAVHALDLGGNISVFPHISEGNLQDVTGNRLVALTDKVALLGHRITQLDLFN